MDIDKDQMIEFQKCAESAEYFLENYAKTVHPARGLIGFALYDYQKRMLKEFQEKLYNIVVKFRQAGVSTLSVIYGLWTCVFRLDQRVLLCSKSDREARYYGKLVKKALTNLPEWMLPQPGKQNDHFIEFPETGSSIGFFNLQASCGRKANLTIIDEAAFIPNMEELWECLYPMISCGGSVIVNSTPNGKDNWFYHAWDGALKGANQFNAIQIDYTEHPEYNNEEWVKNMKENLGPKGWAQEIECKFGYDEPSMTEEVNTQV